MKNHASRPPSPKGAKIRAQIALAGLPFRANDNIAAALKPGDLETIETEVAGKFAEILDALVIDPDHNTAGTASRVAKMFVREVFSGRYQAMPVATDFPNALKLDEMLTVGPVTVRSACSHHFCPVQGQAWVGVIPNGRVIGLSKFSRITEWVMQRPQIQEEATVQLADVLEKILQPRGLALVVRASHSCMTWRGTREAHTSASTQIMRGIFRDVPAARAEFMAAIQGQGFHAL